MASAHLETTTAVETIHSQSADGFEEFADLEIMELELAIDHDVLKVAGFESCLRDACALNDFEYLFQLPAFDQVRGQKIAVLSTGVNGKLVFAILNDEGDDVEIVRQDDMPGEISSFAKAFLDVFSQLGEIAA